MKVLKLSVWESSCHRKWLSFVITSVDQVTNKTTAYHKIAV